jgi:hypothetical protein
MFQYSAHEIIDVDLGYAITVFDCRDEVFRNVLILSQLIDYGDREGWPDIQRCPRGCFFRADNSQVETPRRSKDNISPSSTHLSQRLPPPRGREVDNPGCAVIPVEVEYV